MSALLAVRPCPSANRLDGNGDPDIDRIADAATYLCSVLSDVRSESGGCEGRAMMLEQAVREAKRNEAVGPETCGMPSSDAPDQMNARS